VNKFQIKTMKCRDEKFLQTCYIKMPIPDRSVQVQNIADTLQRDPTYWLVISFIHGNIIANDPIICELIRSGLLDPAEVLNRSPDDHPALIARYIEDTRLFHVYFVDPQVGSDVELYYPIHEVGKVTFKQHLLSLSLCSTSATLYRP